MVGRTGVLELEIHTAFQVCSVEPTLERVWQVATEQVTWPAHSALETD